MIANAMPVQVEENTLICFCQKEMNSFIDTVCDGYIFNFSRKFLSCLQMELSILASKNPTQVILPERLYSAVTPEMDLLLSSILEEYHSKNLVYKNEILNCLMRSLILQVSRNSGFKAASPYPPEDIRLVNRFLEMVSHNFIQIKRVADYADMLCISPNYLNIKVKRVSGYTASQHIQQFILTEAIGKVLNEGFGLKQTAYYLGYEDSTYFSKFFKKATGKSFTEFRMEATK